MNNKCCEFGRRLKEARQRKGLTREKFALNLGVDPSCAYWWEVGRNYPHIERLVEISATLGVSIDWLLLGNENHADLWAGT